MSSDPAANNRLSFIRNNLAIGKSREEIAGLLGYKNWRSLDIYMRRTGAKWDSEGNSYIYPEKQEPGRAARGLADYAGRKVAAIISKFSGKDADPLTIARECGFRDHRELSSYMAARGYKWSGDSSNYVKVPLLFYREDRRDPAKETDQKRTTVTKRNATEDLESSFDNNLPDFGDNKNSDLSFKDPRYLNFLELLYSNREKLLSFIAPGSTPDNIPRYTVPGITRTKSFYMSDGLSRLISEFSETMNISQKEIVEAAVIEFLKRYSFQSEVNELLGRK